jgi:DNA-binding NarL/FixJ family response regulator
LGSLKLLTGRFRGLRVVVLSASENILDMECAFDNGAVGFVPKSSKVPVLLSALQLVLAGGVYVPSTIPRNSSNRSAPKTRKSGELTPRQSEVLARMIEGKSNKLIATELGMSEATVKVHVAALFRSLNVANRTQAIVSVTRKRLVDRRASERTEGYA